MFAALHHCSPHVCVVLKYANQRPLSRYRRQNQGQAPDHTPQYPPASLPYAETQKNHGTPPTYPFQPDSHLKEQNQGLRFQPLTRPPPAKP
jgi:hypothetical protein